MAPSVAVDTTPDLPPSSSAPHPSAAPQRTLLLAPPSISAHPEALSQILSSHDRQHTDIQMLDRLALNLAALPTSTYDAVLLLTDADGSRAESRPLLTRAVMGKIAGALRPGGRLRSQDGAFGGDAAAAERTEAILAGLVQARDGAGMEKPDYGEQAQAVPLRLGRGRKANAAAGGVTVEGAAVGARGGKRKGGADDEPATPAAAARPAGVGFVDFSDDFGVPMVTGEEGGDDDDDDELIDEDALLTEADLARPIVQPPECRPKAGKRRRACKDCTCGLRERLAADDAAARAAADAAVLKLRAADLAEVDFTVQGKVGSCGNCALGDAFRCDGCPYVGLPAFRPGEEVRLVNEDVQL